MGLRQAERRPRKMGYELIYIDERAEWLGKAAAWFHQKWGIPLEAYRESMEERGTKMLYLLTDHICFDERYGWEYLCDAMGEGEAPQLDVPKKYGINGLLPCNRAGNVVKYMLVICAAVEKRQKISAKGRTKHCGKFERGNQPAEDLRHYLPPGCR